MLRAGFHRSDQRQHFIGLETVGRLQVGQFRAALGQRAGLVQRDHTHIAQGLQRFTLAEQHAQLGRAAGADHDRGRRGQAHRAGAGNDQHCHGVHQRKGQRRRRAEHQPDQEGQRSGGHHRRHEPHGDLVDQRLDRQLGALGLLDQTDDLRQHRVPAHLGDAETEGTGGVERTAHNFRAHGLGHRHRLTGDHAFVDIGGTLHHRAIDRHLLAGADQHDVAQGDLLKGHFDGLTTALHARGPRLQPHQPLDRLRGTALGPRLERAPEQDQGHDDDRRFEVDIRRARRQYAWCEGRDHGIAIGCRGTERDQRVHVGGAAQQCRHALAEEAQARPEQHQRGQRELQVPAGLQSDGMHHPVVHGRNEVRAHFQNEDRQGQQRRQQQGAAQRARFAFAAFLLLVTGRGRAHADRARGVAGVLHGGLQIGDGHRAGQMAHVRPLGGQVDAGRDHARQLRKTLFHATDAGRTRHPLDAQLGGLFADVVARAFDGAHRSLRVGRADEAEIGPLGGKVDRGALHAGDGGQRTLHPAYAGGTGHALDGQTQAADRRAGPGSNRRHGAVLGVRLPATLKIPIMGRSSPS